MNLGEGVGNGKDFCGHGWLEEKMTRWELCWKMVDGLCSVSNLT